MTVRRLLTTRLLFIVSLFLMAFQGEPVAPETTDAIPWLIWILLLLVAVGLLFLAWGRRDVDAFSAEHEHHDDHGHGHGVLGDDEHSHEGHAHAHDISDVAVGTEPVAEEVHATVVPVPPVAMAMSPAEPVMPTVVEVVDEGINAPDEDIPAVSAPDTDLGLQTAALDTPDLPAVEIPDVDTPAVTMAVDMDAPAVELPRVNVPDVDVPDADMPRVDAGVDLPDLDAPDLNMPDVDLDTPAIPRMDVGAELPDLDAPDVSVPDVDIDAPDLPRMDMSADSPDFDAPNIDLPGISVQDIEFGKPAALDARPDGDMPDLDLPDWSAPHIDEVEPELTDTAPDIEFPNLSAATPAVTLDSLETGKEEASWSNTPDADIPDKPGTTSSLGMRDRPTFPRVTIPDTLPSAEGAIRDTMEFRMGEDNPGEIFQRPASGESYEPTLMSTGMEDAPEPDLGIPELDVPDLGMPALDAASSTMPEPDTEAIAPLANVSLEAGLYEDTGREEARGNFGDTPGLNGGDMIQKMELMDDSAPASSEMPDWFTGGVDMPSTPAPTQMSAPAPSGDWETTTLEPPNTAEGSAELPVIHLPAYDSDLSGAPKWLVTGDDDDSNDDLQIVEGIGPKIASVLNSAGIRSFRRLAGTSVDNLREILDKAGISHIADPSTWGEQAQHAAEGALDKLQELQERLKGGRKE